MITEELKAWLLRQTQKKMSPVDVLTAMTQSGWKEEDALLAIEMVLEQHLAQQEALKSRPQHPAPYLDIDASRSEFDLGLSWKPRLVQFVEKPYVALIENFLSDTECDMLIELSRPRLAPSTVINYDAEKGSSNTGKTIKERSSQGMFFRRSEQLLISEIEERISKLTHWPVIYGEGIQVLNYLPGGEYKAHHDYFDLERLGRPTEPQLGHQRVGTLIMYLNEPVAGGGTEMTDIKFTAVPKKGAALFFNYPTPDTTTLTLHAGLPVLEGEKWIATKWLRDGPFQV